ncbi:MAG: hypothetical protein K6T83_08660 [Alicyclobacillus sp.]|nr:hypothetical protein [Alicyclobacillus sp.]
MRDEDNSLLYGTIDFHVHAEPSIFPRSETDFTLVQKAREMGLGGIVLKAHEGSTAERAYLLNAHYSDFTVYGSITLNHFVGGINPAAVELAMALGARVVWFPTIHAENHIKFYGGSVYSEQSTKLNLMSRPGIRILSDTGKLRAEVQDVIDIVVQNNGVLCTGHLSPLESLELIRAAKERGAQKIVFTHPDLPITQIDIAVQEELARQGVFLEKSYLTMLHPWGTMSLEFVVRDIERLGANVIVLQTDLGQRASPLPITGWKDFLFGLLKCGVSPDTIKRISKENARWLLKK